MNDTNTTEIDRPTCEIRGCINDADHDGTYCRECSNDMMHYALDLAGVP